MPWAPIVSAMWKAGFTNITSTENGEEAYKTLDKAVKEGTLDKVAEVIITDIEMPIMDGHRLTKLVKTSPETKDIPLIIFSSLINDEMRRKGEELGADAQLTKPEIGNLVRVIDSLIEERYGLSNALVDYINDRPSGIGLIYTDHAIVPFDYRLPKDNELFRLMNTKPTE